MWLRNFYNMWAWVIVGAKTSTSNFDDQNISVRNVSGTFMTSPTGASYFYDFYPFSTNKDNGFYQDGSKMGELSGICFGGGDTAVSFDDYKLESPLTKSCTISNFVTGTPTYDATTRTWSNTITFDLKNTSSTSVVIKEVGLRTNSTSKILLYREVLEEPITLDAGITMVYSHTFKFVMPIV